MKVLVIWRVKEDADLSQIERMLLEEERFAWRSYLSDELREHYESDMPTPAISILEAESVDAAKEQLKGLPILKAGLMTAEFFPLRPFKNWEVLFKDEEKTGLEVS
ncbi:MAG: superoxide dismutase [Cyanobacteria bacterium J06641_2]